MPPVVEPFSFAKSLHRGQRYNIMCTVVRGDLPVSIHWFKDGRLLAPADQQPAHQVPLAQFEGQASEVQAAEPLAGRQAQQQAAPEAAGIVVKQLDPYSSTLTFASLQSHHRGQYSCEATNEAGRANQSSTLVIHGKQLGAARLAICANGRAQLNYSRPLARGQLVASQWPAPISGRSQSNSRIVPPPLLQLSVAPLTKLKCRPSGASSQRT